MWHCRRLRSTIANCRYCNDHRRNNGKHGHELQCVSDLGCSSAYGAIHIDRAAGDFNRQHSQFRRRHDRHTWVCSLCARVVMRWVSSHTHTLPSAPIRQRCRAVPVHVLLGGICNCPNIPILGTATITVGSIARCLEYPTIQRADNGNASAGRNRRDRTKVLTSPCKVSAQTRRQSNLLRSVVLVGIHSRLIRHQVSAV